MLTIEYFFPLLCWGISVSMTTSGFCRLANSPKANPGEQVLAQAFRFARDSPAVVSRGGCGPGAVGRPRECCHELRAVSVSSQGLRLQVEMKLPGFQFQRVSSAYGRTEAAMPYPPHRVLCRCGILRRYYFKLTRSHYGCKLSHLIAL